MRAAILCIPILCLMCVVEVVSMTPKSNILFVTTAPRGLYIIHSALFAWGKEKSISNLDASGSLSISHFVSLGIETRIPPTFLQGDFH